MRKESVSSLILLVQFLTTVQGQTLTNVRSLYQDLFSNYTAEVMPMSDHSQPLKVGIVLYMISINSFKEVEETMSVTAAISLNWTDPSLAWTPSSYGYLYITIIDPKDMWIPPIFLINRVDEMQPIGHETKFYTTITSTGEVFYTPGGILESKCPTDIAKFPFDTQTCILEILPWGIPNAHITFSSIHQNARLDWFTLNSDWTLQEYSTNVITRSEYDLFQLKLKIKRQPLYYGVMIIFPTMLFALLNPFVFMLPVESGERISLALTILLSYAIFLTLVSANIPASSNPMCVLLVVMVVIIAVSGIIAAGSILSTKYYYEENIGEIWTIFQRFARWRKKRKSNTVVPVDDEKEIVVTGKDVASLLDFLFFYGSYTALILTILAYFIFILV